MTRLGPVLLLALVAAARALGEEEDEIKGTTLAFVFDSTGSMHDELQQAKEGAKRITQTLINHPDKPIHDYVLVPFNDPNIGPATHTTDHIMFQDRLAKISIGGGDDCPEMSVGGILKALELARPNAYIYVFTDASAKDYHLGNEVLDLIQRKRSQVVFLLTGICGHKGDEGYRVFEKISSTSSGQIYNLTENVIEEVLKFVELSVQNHKAKVNIMAVDSPQPTKGKPYPVEVDGTLKEFTVTLSGSNPNISVLDPTGVVAKPPKATPVLQLPTIQAVNVKNPEPGMWTVKIKSDSAHTIRTTGLSDTNFEHGFSVIPTRNLAETAHRPLKGAKNSILIKATHPEALFNLTNLKLIGFEGNVLYNVPLNPISRADGLYGGGPIVPPVESFNMEINGFGEKGHPLTRITSSAITSQMPDLPFVSLKSNITIWGGKPIKIICKVESLVPITVKWDKNGAIQSGPKEFQQSAEHVLDLINVSIKDEGIYICHAKNIAGSSQKEISVSVIEPPKLNKTLDTMKVLLGDKVELPCPVISGKPPLTFTWKKDGSRIEYTAHKSYTMGNGSLMIPVMSKLHPGKYDCIVENVAGSATMNTYLKLYEPPKIEMPSESYIVKKVGEHLALPCKVTGDPPITVTWTKPSYNVINKHRGYRKGGSPDLYIDNVRLSDKGRYVCKATNPAGMDRRPIALGVIAPPKILNWVQELNVMSGELVEMRCNAQADPKAYIHWSSTNSMSNKQSYGGYLRFYAKTSDSGKYTCTAENDVGTDEAHLTLTVHVPAYIPEPYEEDIFVLEGQNAAIDCKAQGAPSPIITWHYSPVHEKSQHSSNIHYSNNKVYIKEAHRNLTGIFYCKAVNSAGTAQKIFRLDVHVRSKILDNFSQKITLKEGDDFSIPCTVDGIPPPAVHWEKGKSIFQPGHRSNEILVLRENTLVLTNVVFNTGGIYTCIATNIQGSAARNYDINILVPPKTMDYDTIPIEVMLGDPVSLNCPILHATGTRWLKDGIELGTVSEDHGVDLHYYMTKRGRSMIITRALLNDNGRYTCIGKNGAGNSKVTFKLETVESPYFRDQYAETNFKIIEGSSVTLDCRMNGIPIPIVHWRLVENDLPVTHHTVPGAIVLGEDKDQLHIKSAKSHHQGRYSCSGKNKIGKIDRNFMVTVVEYPKIEGPKENAVELKRGAPISLTCSVTSNPQPNYQWTFYSSLGGQTVLESRQKSLVIRTSSVDNIGIYTCTGTNEAGSMTQTFKVSIIDPV